MNGEGSDVIVPSPALAGYLGNAKDGDAVSGSCPWCFAKGQKNVLRSYAINFKDSITLCSSPLCLFPLVRGPLDNISLSKDIHGCKRYLALEAKDPDPSLKRQRKFDLDIVSDGKCRNVDVDDCRVYAKSAKKRTVIEEYPKQTDGIAVQTTDVSYVTSRGSVLSDLQIKDPISIRRVPPTDSSVQDVIDMVPTHQHLFWRNKDNLCWLDSLLVALVHSSIIIEAPCENVCLTEKFPCENFTVKNLCATYKNSCAYIKAKEQQCQDNIVRVASDDLRYVTQELEVLRVSAFQFLQPKLQCELGQKETPVFALPLLLGSDDWANSLFHHTGQWEFRCTYCGYSFSTSIEKTVTTFTQIMADWHPLSASHRTKCNNCHKNQKRKLVFQRISLVLALHFVEGLPRRDLSKYAFDFNGTHYSIRTIIQYNDQREHFITWIRQADGLWLEFDDLKHPNCITHRRFTLPAREFHLVFWEADYNEKSQHPDPVLNTLTQKMSKVDDAFEDITNSLLDNTCTIEPLPENTDSNEAASTWDSSIGSTTLLDTFEGLSHNDIVTLSLVEVKADAEDDSSPNAYKIDEPRLDFSLAPEKGPVESSSKEVIPLVEKYSNQATSSVKNTIGTNKGLHSPESVGALDSVGTPQVSECSPAIHSLKPTTSKLSYLFHRHLSHKSTPLRVPSHAKNPKVDIKRDGNEGLLAKPAELFGGYKAKSLPNTCLTEGHTSHPFIKLPNVSEKPSIPSCGITTVGPESMLIKSTTENILKSSQSEMDLSTEALRLKLMKRLKAKKKKLAKLNQLLSIEEGESTPRPDSTNISSPYSVTSSTSACDSPAFDNLFTELLSPDMSTSNLSPDSTGLLEILANNQSVGTIERSPKKNSEPPVKFPVSYLNDLLPTNENVLDKLNPGLTEQQCGVDNAELYALDIFF